jgi:hypothetical protein
VPIDLHILPERLQAYHRTTLNILLVSIAESMKVADMSSNVSCSKERKSYSDENVCFEEGVLGRSQLW